MASNRTGKRQLILDTAYALFLENGYDETKISDIAKAAEIGKGTVYEYFSSKEELFLDLFTQHVADHYYNEMEASLAVCETAEAKLLSYIRFEMATFSLFKNGKHQLIKFLVNVDIFQNTPLQTAICQFMEYRGKTLEGIVREGMNSGEFTLGDPEMVTAALSGSITAFLGVTYNLMTPDGDAEDRNWTAEDLMKLILHGLKAS